MQETCLKVIGWKGQSQIPDVLPLYPQGTNTPAHTNVHRTPTMGNVYCSLHEIMVCGKGKKTLQFIDSLQKAVSHKLSIFVFSKTLKNAHIITLDMKEPDVWRYLHNEQKVQLLI